LHTFNFIYVLFLVWGLINAPSTNVFKNHLDKYWENEEIYYSDHRAEISGGNQSDIQAKIMQES
jgi:hypothetical protein